MNQDYEYGYEWDSSYCYPHSFILINRLGIKDKQALNEAEREITTVRVSQIMEHPCKGYFDLKHLQDIHKFLFRDIYSWAGKLRTVNIAKGNQFCNCVYIESGSKPTFDKLRTEDHYLIGLPPETICEKLSYYLGEINVIHPFREGNGRTQRVFIQYLAHVAGYHVDFTHVTSSEMVEASARAFYCDYQKMTELFQQITTPISITEQEQFIHQISEESSPILEFFQHKMTEPDEDLTEEETLHLTF